MRPAVYPIISCPLSSLSRNIRLRRASVISPSISIFSSLTAMAHSLPLSYERCGARGRRSDHGHPATGLRDDDDVRCLRPLRALAGLERDLRSLGERLEAVTGDVAVMHEKVLGPLGGLDKTETLRIVEPLNGSFCHMKYTSHHNSRTHRE